MKVSILVSMILFASNVFANPVCDIFDKVIMTTTENLAEKLECSNMDAIQMDVEQAFSSLGVCQETEKFIEEENICNKVSDVLIENISGRIPEAWGCNLTQMSKAIEGSIGSICENRNEL